MASNSSDYVARFKQIYLSNPTSGTVSYDGVVIPASVTSRLEAVGLTFASLPNLMRQALLWDMGLVVGEVNGVDMLMQVLVQANATMASIALSFEEYGQSTAGRGLKCTNCSFNNQTYLRQEQMDGTNLAFILKCAVELVSVDANSSIIAQDALPASVIPQPRLYKHQDVTQGWTLPAIHTLPRTAPGASGEATYAKCPTDASHQALIIPCETKFQRSESLNINLPTPSAAMTAWLQEFKATNPDLGDSSSNTGVIVGCSIGALALILLVVAFIWFRRRRQRQQVMDQDIAYTPGPPTASHHQDSLGKLQGGVSSYMTSVSGGGSDLARSRAATALDGVDLSMISIYRLDQDAIDVRKFLGSGAYANVMLGSYKDRDIAIKRLLPGRASLTEVQALVDEIVLMAGFSSPYIIEFVGAVWDKPVDLACVMEYMDLGDLRHYLSHRAPSDFSWSEKLECIYNIIEGLVYLHSFPVIHRDLKSRNVLLDSRKGTKLTDFGISKEQTQDTMTIGVGTYRWMAPEILRDNHYDVAADIFSFGMILSEFGTHHIPYADRVNPRDGKPLIDTAIMAMVIGGDIRPTFPEEMPQALKSLAMECLAHDPESRPTAYMASHLIRGQMIQK
ncbi:hypothetical protein LEN26_006959 [Aphanomyces euteiches]|nr:hypothetical protein AeMF1_002019 [Aphanomyces euteiches]KAH9133870.1 hypothetical protein LEN26_006959 [Aphanomyces euteiches]KAH9193652.1 hypothetical protein AeNC1_004367 [Aphanomyces euteiches]